jgi:glutathione S-transferase
MANLSAATKNSNRLITIPVSHYCEKARWALIRSGIPFVEERHMPPFYRFTTKKYGDGTVPLLITKEAVLTDSDAILRWADQNATNQVKLYPSDRQDAQQVEQLVKQFDSELAPAVRQWVYAYTLDLVNIVKPLWCEGAPWYECLLFPIMYKPIRGAIIKGYGIDPQSAAKSYDQILKTFEIVNSLLADGQNFLVGNQFSAADLAFATLAAPLVSPVGYGVKLPSLTDLPIEMSKKMQLLQASTAGKFVLRLYQEHQQQLNHG